MLENKTIQGPSFRCIWQHWVSSRIMGIEIYKQYVIAMGRDRAPVLHWGNVVIELFFCHKLS
jgi:hypothetical protein